MITEDYVSFETAKLLKENGFDERCSHAYRHDGMHLYCGDVQYTKVSNSEIQKDKLLYCTCPTLQMAMKWLLDTYKLHIVPTPYPHEDGKFYWAYKIGFLDTDTLAVMVVKQKAGFDSKEKACEAAIKYCLEKLI